MLSFCLSAFCHGQDAGDRSSHFLKCNELALPHPQQVLGTIR